MVSPAPPFCHTFPYAHITCLLAAPKHTHTHALAHAALHCTFSYTFLRWLRQAWRGRAPRLTYRLALLLLHRFLATASLLAWCTPYLPSPAPAPSTQARCCMDIDARTYGQCRATRRTAYRKWWPPRGRWVGRASWTVTFASYHTCGRTSGHTRDVRPFSTALRASSGQTDADHCRKTGLARRRRAARRGDAGSLLPLGALPCLAHCGRWMVALHARGRVSALHHTRPRDSPDA